VWPGALAGAARVTTDPSAGTVATFDVGVIGAGPAGLMAAEVMAEAGLRVTVFDASASAGRKFLLAGKGGLNLTHSEPFERFLGRYHGGGPGSAEAVAGWLQDFSPDALRAWCAGLGVDTFVGSSGRVFPTSMKAAPLLRAWLHRLRGQGVRFEMRQRWIGWTDSGGPRFAAVADGAELVPSARAWVLALGGASWPHLGSDGAWVPLLRQRGVEVSDLQAANGGFEVARQDHDGALLPGWSEHLRSRFAGSAVKNVAARVGDAGWTQEGELLLTDAGVEGNLVYAASSRLRAELNQLGQATLWLNLLPAFSAERIKKEVAHPRGSRSWATHLKSRLGLNAVKLALLHECLQKDAWQSPGRIADTLMALPIIVRAARPIDEAISSAGGIAFGSVSTDLELKAVPGIFCAGEMLDWDAPTGGYLLTACMASGRAAGRGVIAHFG